MDSKWGLWIKISKSIRGSYEQKRKKEWQDWWWGDCTISVCGVLTLIMEKAVAPYCSTLAWQIPWTQEPGRLQSMGLLGVGHDWATLLSLFTFHFHALEKEMATHSSILAWRIPGTEEPGGLSSLGSHRVGHNWRDLAAAAADLDKASNHLVRNV